MEINGLVRPRTSTGSVTAVAGRRVGEGFTPARENGTAQDLPLRIENEIATAFGRQAPTGSLAMTGEKKIK